MRVDEGYIKFNLNWEKKSFDFNDTDFSALNFYRQELFESGLIGAYPDGIGFGNISMRYDKHNFIISGSETGNLKNLSKEHYALVEAFNIKENRVHCVGLTKASSESLSHAAIYKINLNVNGVIHVHNQEMWKRYIHKLPTTNKDAEFGTPGMASEISRYAGKSHGVIIMGGHPEGIISYGITLNDAYNELHKYF
ncbi:MAG: hypothetical protein A2X13_07910 [Bacteroidetes bacterium GWC2_33_15]|nr:MAG: hypothetical protein A2X10_04965 [Bacteroidetes bacterium GWA2_33_15]OFX52674.1 MAG: hypothetical protein A2X13_07910 [Bacteroidetes bacterium GWC2_33_15]OFX64020.1 MAG: hypothetical protein A2X15_02425 [Bacteroidetes bacterium GWB2_32_14]OFX67295.1 MAG: hypothetical protein A2X14_11990 [Bacteroidetes bacterium GWD2_33_33]HAN18844.1 rRNA adenine methyltransferase [Bacteroidales bacterium]